jgi:hypothetical protein
MEEGIETYFLYHLCNNFAVATGITAIAKIPHQLWNTIYVVIDYDLNSGDI